MFNRSHRIRYIENGNLYIGGWRNSGASINNYASTSISANTAYTATMIWDRTSQTYTAYLNGDEVGNFNIGNNAQSSHSGNITIGYNSDSRRFNGSTASNNSAFGGELGEFIQYNTALTTTERKNLDQYMSLRWSPTLSAPGEDYTFSLETLEAQLPKANITLMAEDNITISDIADNSLDLAFDANGSLTMIADNNGDGVGTISMDASDRIVTQGGALTLRGADLSLAALESNGGNITLDATNNITYSSLNAGSGAITVNLDNNNNSLSTLSAGTTTADSIVLNGGTDLNDTLTVTGNIAATGAGGVQINNFQTANLGADLTMGNQNFSVSTLNTTAAVTLNTGTGTFTVDTLGGTADLTVTTTNANATINTGIATTGGVNINTGTGNISVNGAITQADDITLTSNGGNIVLASAVNNTGNPNFNAGAGNVTLNGALGQTTAVQSLAATAANISTLRVKTTGAQTYNGPITLNNDLETAGGNVTFNGAVTLGANTDITTNNGNVAFTQSLDGTKNIGITAGTGTVDFASSGQNTRLREVDVYSAGNVTFNNNFDAREVDIRSTGAVTGGLITTDRLGVGGSSATLTGVVAGLAGKGAATVTTKLTPSGAGPFTINGFTFPPVAVAPTQQPRSLDRVNQFASNTGGQTALLVNEGRVGTSGGSRIVNPAQGVRTSALTKPNNPYSNDFKLVEPAKGQEAAYRGVSYLFNDLWSYLSKRATSTTSAQPDTLARKE